ncbi:MAG: dihydroorotate dehydrogenase electron transfer subunit [Gammaproteobacteria bacterium]|nr:dihydroorotate dehydrogenase electron transfer subunit [Gammaproteobacteria bacterium]
MRYPIPSKIIEITSVTSVGHSIWLEPKEPWLSAPTPGQFAMVWLPHPPDGYKPEVCNAVPMSIAGWDDGRVRITIKDLGPTSKALLACQCGDWLGLTGPLGHGFSLDGHHPLLMGGGVGAPPLLYLAQSFAAQGIEPITLLGGTTKDEIFHRDEFPGAVELSTDDGSAGHHGRVTELLASSSPDRLYSCGPEPMLVNGLQWALQHHVAAELCLERYMACGIGLCGICSLDQDLVCQDGPVFTSERLANSREFGTLLREAGGRVQHLSG